MAPVMDETNGISPVPPGFVSLKSFTLQRVQDSSLASKTANDPRKTMIDDESSATGVVKLRKSLRYRPWVNYCQFDKSSDEESDSELSDQDAPSIRCLPKGVIRGCTECGNCQKVIARWRPEESCRPMLDDAPVFYPSEEEFKDTLKYIASIRPTAESYGICRIVPPPSWKPSCPLKEKHLWEGSNFTTRIQRVDKLQNRDTVKKLLRNHSMMKRKRRRLAKMNAAFGENNVDILEINETGPYSQRFGFAQGPDFTLDSFQKYADHFKEQYFCSSLNANLSSEQWEPSIENIEGEYWRIVEHPTEEIEVLYGADLETGMFGSGFPKATSGSLDSVDWYAKSSWNLNNVPRLPGSVLAFESGEISGVLVPWLYVGMCFSSFCWHVEDHHLYSVNYLHWGAPKIWYGVPGREALNLEAAMKKHLTDLFEDQPNLLHNLVTQFSPSILKLESVPVYRCIQHPGEFVLTFPRAYHSGFNCGFNCAEAVNIAPVDWLPHGQNAVELYCEQMRKITISHDKLLLGAAREAVRALWNVLFLKEDTPENRVWKDTSGPVGILAKSLKARVELERTRREHLSSSQIRKMDPAFDAESERECVLCHFDLHLSAAGCPCSPDKFACLVHAKHLCSCDWKTRFFLFRYEITELNTLSDAVGGKLSAVHKWGVQDLKLSLSSYVNKEKSYQSRFSDQDCSEAKGNEKVSMSLGFSASSKNTNSAQVVMGSVLKHFSAETKASTKILPVDSTSVITNTTLCQRMMSTVPSATKEPCLQDNSSLKVKHAENLKSTEVCISSYDKSSEEFMVNTKAMRSIANGRNYFGYSLLEQDVKQQCHINSGVSSAGNNIAASKDDSLLYNVGNRREQIIPLNLGKDKPNSGEDSRNLSNFDGKETICNFPNKHVSVLPKLCPAVDNQRDDKQDGLKSIAHGLMPSSLEPNEQGKGDSSGNCSSNSASHSPVVSIAQVASDHKKCVNTSIGRHVFDLLETKEVGECGTKPARSDQKQQCSGSLTGSSNAEEFNKVGKVSESDSLNSWRDNGDLAETCSSFPLNTVHRQNHMQKGPRIAKVVRRINYNVELLDYGVVHSGRLWSTSQAIFPKGYRSRVRYWSILDPTQMCYYVSEILDAEPLGPLFMIKLEQSPTEIFFHVCATKCWNIVRERVNNEIRRLHNLGRVNLPSLQPPGSVDGLEMFGLTFPTIIQAIEAMDKNRICSEYWKSRPKIPNPYDGVDQRAISTSLESKGPLQPVLTGAAAKLKSLFKKASSEELHALYLTLMMDEPGSKHDLLELIKEENQSRLGFDL